MRLLHAKAALIPASKGQSDTLAKSLYGHPPEAVKTSVDKSDA